MTRIFHHSKWDVLTQVSYNTQPQTHSLIFLGFLLAQIVSQLVEVQQVLIVSSPSNTKIKSTMAVPLLMPVMARGGALPMWMPMEIMLEDKVFGGIATTIVQSI